MIRQNGTKNIVKKEHFGNVLSQPRVKRGNTLDNRESLGGVRLDNLVIIGYALINPVLGGGIRLATQSHEG